MGPHQAGRRLLTLALVIVAACGTSGDDTLAEGLADRLEFLADDRQLQLELSADEARCWGREMANEIAADRWQELGVVAPDYGFAEDLGFTDADNAGLFNALERCVNRDEILGRMIVYFQVQLTSDQLDCIVDGLGEAGIGPFELSRLRQAQLSPEELEDEAAAVAINDRCVPAP